jgi:hypothetical protein
MPKILLVKYKYEADKKVYFVDYPYEADEKVFIVKYAYEADYKGFEVKYAYEADTKVYRVKYAYEADEFKRSSRTPKSNGLFSSSGSSSSDNSSTTSDFSSGSSFDTSSTTSNVSSSGGCDGGCFTKLISWLFVLAIIGGALKYFGIIDDESPEGNSAYIINTKGLNLRTEPGTTSEVIKLMIQNDSIWQLNDSSLEIGSQTWIYVTDKVDTGWVNENYVQ